MLKPYSIHDIIECIESFDIPMEIFSGKNYIELYISDAEPSDGYWVQMTKVLIDIKTYTNFYKVCFIGTNGQYGSVEESNDDNDVELDFQLGSSSIDFEYQTESVDVEEFKNNFINFLKMINEEVGYNVINIPSNNVEIKRTKVISAIDRLIEYFLLGELSIDDTITMNNLTFKIDGTLIKILNNLKCITLEEFVNTCNSDGYTIPNSRVVFLCRDELLKLKNTKCLFINEMYYNELKEYISSLFSIECISKNYKYR
jgi:hypothetical protein